MKSNRPVELPLCPARIGPERLESLMEETYPLLVAQATRYTMGDSGSLPAETMRELLAGILYLADLRLRLHPDADPSLPLAALRKAGLFDAQRLTKRCALLYRQALLLPPPVKNLAYEETVFGLKVFFTHYNPDFFPQDLCCSIDYPLAVPLPEGTQGVEYFHGYLRRLNLENAFLRRLGENELRALLRGCCPDFEGQLINLYLPAAEAAVGRALAGKRATKLAMDDGDRKCVLSLFSCLSGQGAAPLLEDAARRAARDLSLSGDAQNYFIQATSGLLPRLLSAAAQGSLLYVFPPSRYEPMPRAFI